MGQAVEEKESILNSVDEVLQKYNPYRENLVPILQRVQDKLGYLPTLAMEKIASILDIPPVDVFGVATFYNQFRLNPPGDNEFKVCMGTACYMVGGEIALDSLERRLGIKEGETTGDRKYSLERVACVGCCSMAPVVVINEDIEGYVTPTKVDGLLNSLVLEVGSESGDKKEQGNKEGEQEA